MADAIERGYILKKLDVQLNDGLLNLLSVNHTAQFRFGGSSDIPLLIAGVYDRDKDKAGQKLDIIEAALREKGYVQ